MLHSVPYIWYIVLAVIRKERVSCVIVSGRPIQVVTCAQEREMVPAPATVKKKGIVNSVPAMETWREYR